MTSNIMANVRKRDIVNTIAEKTGLTGVDTAIVVDSLLATISESLQQGKNIEIRGFGRFKVRKQKARIARNPKTGERVHVEAGFKPVFKASKQLIKKVEKREKT